MSLARPAGQPLASSLLKEARRRSSLSQRELGARAGTSGPTIAAYEAGHRVPRVDTLERLLEAAGCELHVELAGPAAARDASSRRSLELHRAVLQRLRADPDGVRSRARRNLARMRAQHRGGRSDPWFDDWERLLDGPLEDLALALVDPTQLGVDRRQVTPFAGILSTAERWAIFASRRPGDAA